MKWFKNLFRMSSPKKTIDEIIAERQEEVEQVKAILQSNIKRMYERSENINELEKRANQLKLAAKKFKKSSSRVNDLMWFRNFKNKMTLGAVVFGLIMIALSILLNSTGVILPTTCVIMSLCFAAISTAIILGVRLYADFKIKKAPPHSSYQGISPPEADKNPSYSEKTIKQLEAYAENPHSTFSDAAKAAAKSSAVSLIPGLK